MSEPFDSPEHEILQRLFGYPRYAPVRRSRVWWFVWGSVFLLAALGGLASFLQARSDRASTPVGGRIGAVSFHAACSAIIRHPSGPAA